MWHCVISGGVIACQSARNCFKYYNLWYAVRFAWCHWGKISKFNIFHFLPASAVSVSDNFSSPHGDSRWGRGKWLEVTVTDGPRLLPTCASGHGTYKLNGPLRDMQSRKSRIYRRHIRIPNRQIKRARHWPKDCLTVLWQGASPAQFTAPSKPRQCSEFYLR